MNDDWQDYSFDTLAVRAGQQRTHEGEHSEAIFPTSSFVFESAAQAAARFAHKEEGNIYSRFTNPTVRNFQQRLAALEQGEDCIATASGMGAIMSVCLGLLQAGDHIIASRSIFGSTVNFFTGIIAKFGVETTFVELDNIEEWQQAITKNTKLMFLETPSNPLMEMADIRQLADLAHQHDILLCVDNCFCTPALQKPLTLGADIVVHSATKYLDGQGRCIGGAVVSNHDFLHNKVLPVMRSAGPSMSPFNAWVFLKGLETLNIRMQAHCSNALRLAKWLDSKDMVEKVYHPGLPSHPQHELAKKQQANFGGLVSFELKGGREAAWKVIDSTKLMSITANLGDVKTTITHPATTTHGRLTDEQRAQANIRQGLIRLSVGLEDVVDLEADLARGLMQL
ncbi:O-succinylhomoserine sulfhydrylase [Candidatus Albibeggiatoa sp. nov. NOAA]|uniref:O-succinylhomoserine sulfhydrylase n=1 Tax=Candidatus Albibeggiatoa sp. nov. NOAA TaxID=3162724 RepID=UPI0032F44C20|nr:O-succinylhomoserine sulfhydrylase [Thiotrichaceae bacterium]